MSRDSTTRRLVTMASIVEKEAKAPGERPLIAGVFYNRLRLKMPLQSDPTAEYELDGASESQRPRSTPRRRSTRTISRACRRVRSPIPASSRSKRRYIRRTRTFCISSRAKAAEHTCSPSRSPSISG